MRISIISVLSIAVSIARYFSLVLSTRMLVVYCLKNVGWVTGTHGIPELLCIAITALLHIWKHNNLLSIGVGTVLYMVLVQNVFV